MSSDTLTDQGKAFFAELAKLVDKEVRVGFQTGQATNENGADLCEIAVYNELGTEFIPPRPFIRQTADNNEEQILSFMEVEADRVANGGSAEDCLKRIGVMSKGLMQETIKDGDFAPNAFTTVKNKGSSKPLIDTGAMRQGVNYQIKRKGDG